MCSVSSRNTNFISPSTEVSPTTWSNMETKATNTLLISALSLCVLGGTVLSQHRHCTRDRCFALFQEPRDFPSAQKSCEDSAGEFLKFNSTEIETLLDTLPDGLTGSYWLELQTAEGKGAHVQLCAYISLSTGRNFTVLQAPCTDKLSGFLCQYVPCSSLQAARDTQVKYVNGDTSMIFQVHDSNTYPPGTLAEARKAGAKHPDSKHLCFLSSWYPAPWFCEVMLGGCEHGCNSTTKSCTCPTGQALHSNKITCVANAHQCQREGDNHECKCRQGYVLGPDGGSCVDVNECEGPGDPCTGVGEWCHNTEGDFKCTCKDGFDDNNGSCVYASICDKCEHMLCTKFNGVYRCNCRNGFQVSPEDPTRCERHCLGDCLASCIPNTDDKNREKQHCSCPDGYILDIRNSTATCVDINECLNEEPCDHTCENVFGSFRCFCDEGFRLEKGYMCVKDEVTVGPGTTPVYPKADAVPGSIPPYVKYGSALGITVFMSLAAALLFLAVHHAVKRCSRFDLSSFKHSNMDNFYLQQVTTDTYKRLSFDKNGSKNDS